MYELNFSFFRYSWRTLSGDLFGGFIAALIAIPYGLAMATMMGLPPVLGLVTSIVSAPITALLGRNPVLIGGRPNFFWTSYAVYAFECGVLAATMTGFVGFLIACRMPALYEPEDECDALRDATRDGWFLLLRDPDERARATLRELRPDFSRELRG